MLNHMFSISRKSQIIRRSSAHSGQYSCSIAAWPNQSSHSKEKAHRRTDEEQKHGRLNCIKQIERILNSKFDKFTLQKSLTPNLPDDQAISFYLQSHKLIFAVYQLTNVQGVMKFDSSQAECSVPWLNEVLVLFTVALQLCQQLKDKVSNLCFF